MFNEISFPSLISLLCGALVLYFYVILKAVSCKSNTGTWYFRQINMKNRFWAPRVFKPEILEICEFVWSNRIFPEVFSAMAFDWSHQIAKRICNEGAAVQQGVVPSNRKISKIENFMKYWRWWRLKLSFSMNFLRWREFHCLRRLPCIIWFEERLCWRVIPSPRWLGEFVAKNCF